MLNTIRWNVHQTSDCNSAYLYILTPVIVQEGILYGFEFVPSRHGTFKFAVRFPYSPLNSLLGCMELL